MHTTRFRMQCAISESATEVQPTDALRPAVQFELKSDPPKRHNEPAVECGLKSDPPKRHNEPAVECGLKSNPPKRHACNDKTKTQTVVLTAITWRPL